MKKIIVEIVEDKEIGGYTVSSTDIFDSGELVIDEGDSIADALNNFADTVYDIKQYKNERNNK